MVDSNWLWAEPMGIPESEDVGPALGSEEIARWERQNGVVLPTILKRAYGQQDGVYLRGSDLGVVLLRLRDIEPVEADFFDDLTWNNDVVDINASRFFYLGGDDTGATLLLDLREDGADTVSPAVYAYYSDGGEINKLTDTVEALFNATPEED